MGLDLIAERRICCNVKDLSANGKAENMMVRRIESVSVELIGDEGRSAHLGSPIDPYTSR